MKSLAWLAAVFATVGSAQPLGRGSAPREYAPLEAAYRALAARDYGEALAGFEQAVALAPARADIRKDYAYTLLKVGETAAARDQFAEVMRLDPADEHAALEYAFLCYETQQPAAARRTFDRLRRRGNQAAAEAFENIDRPLREGIARWQQVLRGEPENFSAHEELARLAEQREEWSLAAEHYELAWRLRPGRRDLLLELGRSWREQAQTEKAHAALLAASRGAEPRVAEAARALLPERYPYVYEFEAALRLDPGNEELRRELAYLHQAMGNREAAAQEFAKLPERAPAQSAAAPPVLLQRWQATPEARTMAERSFEKGYLLDAARYWRSVHESDPADFDVMMKLGWTYNLLKNDREAVRWFDLARRSPDRRLAAEASRAYGNLASGLRRWRGTVWMFPMFSTRWRNAFAYAQAKAEWKLPGLRPYASVRFIGDARGPLVPVAGLGPQYLSERSVIVAAGLALPTWRGATLWWETGAALRYSDGWRELDQRGGLAYAARRAHRQWFAETNDDLLYVRRFNRNTLLYSQNRTGWALNDAVQFYWNWNATLDRRRESWANTAETGPGVRWRVNGMEFSANYVRGAYLLNQGNPYRPNYFDLRIGIWYALSR
jgi:Tfp pilus assembly protein PilF